MLKFKDYLIEEAESDGKLKHITHPEDRPLMHGASGFNRAYGSLSQAHNTMVSGKQTNSLTMKYDGSPAVVFGHHPETGKFFVATKSAFNKNPKLNYTNKDIEANHGHAPGLVSKLKAALAHLPKVAPKTGVYQGDIMFSGDDVHHDKNMGTSTFRANTITYTAKGAQAKKIAKAKLGVVVHTQYKGKTLETMRADHNVNHSDFGNHPDVYHHDASHDTGKISYPKSEQKVFQQHLDKAKEIHDKNPTMYRNIHPNHSGDAGLLSTYINSTIRRDTTPTVEGFKKHVSTYYENKASKVKTDKGKAVHTNEGNSQVEHIERNKEHYKNALEVHNHLAKAKNVLVKHLETHEGGYEHRIGDNLSKPEGFVVHHRSVGVTMPDKLVNRSEFAKANLLKTAKG